jgi:enoyl-CoA hydratase/carnithine racemase
MDEERISVDLKDGVADVRLMRADKMNALDDAMFQALIDTGERLKADNSVRAIVLSGEGRAFCAGLDTSNFGKMASGERRGGSGLTNVPRTAGGSNRAQHAVMVWREQPVPVIAAVHGVAFGGGFQLTLGADIRIVAPDAKLSILEIKWGLVPDMAGMVLLRGLVRDDIARELTWSGRVFTGAEAQGLGLATKVSETPREDALAMARAIAGRNPHAIRAGKRLFAAIADGTQKDILLLESEEQGALIGSPNQVEAVMAAMQNRQAVFADVA